MVEIDRNLAAALRADIDDRTNPRVIAVMFVSAVTFVLLRSVPVVGLLLAPVFPFTSLGVADHLSERREAIDPTGRRPLRTHRRPS